VRCSPQKARLVVDQIRGLAAGEARTKLAFSPKGIAPTIAKALASAMANAEEQGADVDELTVTEVFVDEGPRLKRIRPAPMGRAYRYVRRMCHITVRVSDGQVEETEE